jgi:hypothetical protein
VQKGSAGMGRVVHGATLKESQRIQVRAFRLAQVLGNPARISVLVPGTSLGWPAGNRSGRLRPSHHE